MSKRQQFNYDNGSLVENLKASTGQGVNALFSGPSPSPKTQSIVVENGSATAASPADRTEARLPVRKTERTNGRTDAPVFQLPAIPKKRRPERYAFQFWADQVTRLRKLHKLINLLDDPDDRSTTTLSDLVREALDDYLARKTADLQHQLAETTNPSDRADARTNERPNGRTPVRQNTS